LYLIIEVKEFWWFHPFVSIIRSVVTLGQLCYAKIAKKLFSLALAIPHQENKCTRTRKTSVLEGFDDGKPRETGAIEPSRARKIG
jgi:hypothetical protein